MVDISVLKLTPGCIVRVYTGAPPKYAPPVEVRMWQERIRHLKARVEEALQASGVPDVAAIFLPYDPPALTVQSPETLEAAQVILDRLMELIQTDYAELKK